MSKCLNPTKAHRASDGNISFVGKNSYGELWLPCSQCINCRKTYSESWGVRMMHEASEHPENCFLTLTYSDDHLPPNGSLDYSHTQTFIKNLRAALSYSNFDRKIKYYLAGEYGDQLGRPHYHAILFGFDFSAPVYYKGRDNSVLEEYTKDGNVYREFSFLDDLWQKGKCNVGEVNYETCRYTASYVSKKVSGRSSAAHYGSKLPERAFMSNGIGRTWLERFYADVYPDDFCIHSGKRLKVPKYYDRWLETHNSSLFQQVKLSREASMMDMDIDHSELVRIHQVKLLNQQQYSNDLTGAAPTNAIDQKIIAYNKVQSDWTHERKKHVTKNVRHS